MYKVKSRTSRGAGRLRGNDRSELPDEEGYRRGDEGIDAGLSCLSLKHKPGARYEEKVRRIEVAASSRVW